MNFRDPKNQIILVIAFLFVAAIYLWYNQIYSSYAYKIKAKSTEVEKMKANVYQVQQKAATLKDLEKELEELQIKYQKVQLLLPERKEDEALISQLHAAAQLTGALVKDVTPLGAVAQEYYVSNNYSVEVQSSYHSLGSFFAKLANFPFIVNISDLELKSEMATLSQSGANTPGKDDKKIVIATFKLSTYNAKQGA
jgi:Tfp pilus assembly protein PilO